MGAKTKIMLFTYVKKPPPRSVSMRGSRKFRQKGCNFDEVFLFCFFEGREVKQTIIFFFT